MTKARAFLIDLVAILGLIAADLIAAAVDFHALFNLRRRRNDSARPESAKTPIEVEAPML